MWFHYNTDYSLAFNFVANTFVAIGIFYACIFCVVVTEKIVRYFR